MTAPRVLVAYGSRNGSTAELARWIGEALTEAGLRADVRPAGDVASVADYDAVVLGSGLYAGRWLREPVRFARRHRRALLDRPVWLFSSGPLDSSASAGDDDRLPVRAAVKVADRLDAQEHVTFGGRLVAGARGFLARQLLAKGRGGDFRDRARVHVWATRVATEIAASTAAHSRLV